MTLTKGETNRLYFELDEIPAGSVWSVCFCKGGNTLCYPAEVEICNNSISLVFELDCEILTGSHSATLQLDGIDVHSFNANTQGNT